MLTTYDLSGSYGQSGIKRLDEYCSRQAWWNALFGTNVAFIL